MSGKIWVIKLLYGSLSVGDKISFYCVDISNQIYTFNKVVAVVKHIKQNLGLEANDKFLETANQGDIISINLKECRVDGKKIDKRDIKIKKNSIGFGQSVICEGFNLIKVKFVKCDDFVNKLKKPFDNKQELHIENNKNKNKLKTRLLLLLLWFGKIIPVTVVNVEGSNVSFRLLNNQELPIPINENFRNHIKRIIIKDMVKVENEGRRKSGIPKWKYYVGELLFDS